MKISEFIQQDKIDETCNPIVEKLIEQALSKLHELYGTDGGWAIKELDAAELDVGVTEDQLIQDVEHYSFWMSNYIYMAMYVGDTKTLIRELRIEQASGQSRKLKFDGHEYAPLPDEYVTAVTDSLGNKMYKYKTRPLFKINGQLVVDATVYEKPLILALQHLITIFDNPSPDVAVVYKATKLIDSALTCQLLVQLNINWICEMSRNTNFQGITAQQKEFDEEPVNKIRKDALMPFAFDHLLKDGSLTVTELYKLIEKPYQKKLVKLYYEGQINDYDAPEKEDIDITKVSKSVMERWLTEFKQLLDAAGD